MSVRPTLMGLTMKTDQFLAPRLARITWPVLDALIDICLRVH